MVLERLKQVASHLTGLGGPPHPFDPLSETEIAQAVAIVSKEHPGLFYNAVTLWEPRKQEMMAWMANPSDATRPQRCADVVAISKGSKVYDGVVNLTESRLQSWEHTPGVQPLITMEDLQIVEHVVRTDPKVI